MWQVTKREYTGQSKWKHWNWRSEGDLFLNGAFFTRSGAGAGAGSVGEGFVGFNDSGEKCDGAGHCGGV